ncbi:FtsX-like permease family protein [Oryzobacter terrae]|uniref:FtsX-like permease family protein n=1 Tax=Oryzobacter terrae TaxID=1620385 RepID=UPI00366E20BB
MTTLVHPDERTGDAPREEPPTPGGSRFATWRSTWSVALRMARRDVRRHRGRSALAVVMVVIPTLLLSALVTFAATSDIAGTELIAPTMGNGQALLEGPDALQISQGVSAQEGYGSGPGEATAVPGFDREKDAFGNADAVAALVGAPVSPVVVFPGRVTVGERRLSVDITALDGRVDLGERLRLLDGRWPTTASEVLVTEAAVARGVPARGTLSVSVDDTASTLTVVGTAKTGGMWTSGGLVVPAPLPGAQASSGSSWIVRGDDPVTWQDLRRLNGHGFSVTSAEVLRNPPTEAQLREAGADTAVAANNELRLMVALGAVMLLTTCTLLVGPAFAVSANRQRRTLALAASNGATTAVLRRTVLSQALVLGGVSAVIGPVVGVAAAYAVVVWTRRDGEGIQAPFDVRPGLLAAIAVCALLSTVVAALVPARRLGRLDIVGVMRGQSVSPRPSPWIFATGVVLAGAGSAVLITATGAVMPDGGQRMVAGLSPDVLVVFGAIALILGSLFLVPLILAGVGRAGGTLPTALRMAARDLARHRARSAPSVAAVLAAVAGLTFGLTGLESDTEQRRAEYVPQTLAGEAVLSAWAADLVPDEASVRTIVPGAVVTQNRVVDTGDPWQTGRQPTEPYRLVFVNVLVPGCTPEQSLGFYVPQSEGVDEATIQKCGRLGTTGTGDASVLVLPADELVRRLDLDEAQATAVRGGAAIARGLDGPSVTVVRGTFAQDPTAQEAVDPDVEVDQQVTVPLVAVPNTKESSGAMLQTGLAFAADTATTRGWPTIARSLTIRTEDGRAITTEQAEQLQQRAGDDTEVQVERGFQREDRLVVGILLGVFALLILVVTLTSTALTLAEQQTDQATLAALGATRGTRRVMAAGQAFLLAAVGCVLGVGVGLVPGIAIAKPLTSDSWDPLTGQQMATDGVLVIPWASLLILGVLVPLVAAALAAAGIRKAPQVTRRAT